MRTISMACIWLHNPSSGPSKNFLPARGGATFYSKGLGEESIATLQHASSLQAFGNLKDEYSMRVWGRQAAKASPHQLGRQAPICILPAYSRGFH